MNILCPRDDAIAFFTDVLECDLLFYWGAVGDRIVTNEPLAQYQTRLKNTNLLRKIYPCGRVSRSLNLSSNT